MTELTEEDRRRLTEFIGECSNWFHRYFDTGNDMMAVKEKLVEKGKFAAFWDFAVWKHGEEWKDREIELQKLTDIEPLLIIVIAWFITPARFAKLASEFLEEEK
jgi:hypothetical protein